MAFIIAIFLSIIWLYIVNKKLVTIFIQFIGASKTYGDEDVWDYIFNSSSPSVRFIHVRDFERHVVYAGDVTVFSETGKLRELLLQDVTVYDFEGTELYSKPSIYMSKPTENMHIEFPTEKEQT